MRRKTDYLEIVKRLSINYVCAFFFPTIIQIIRFLLGPQRSVLRFPVSRNPSKVALIQIKL